MKKKSKFKQTEIGEIPEDWEVKNINNICSKITSGGTPSRNKKEYWKEGKIPWLKTQELNDGRIYNSEEKITKLGLDNSSAKILPINTVLMAMYGATVGKLGILKIEATTNQAFCAMIVEQNEADYEFLFYFLLNIRNKIIGLATGAAQQNLNQDTIKNINLPCPFLEEQSAIAKILSDLDSKIELNQQMNKTLEAIGQAIFKRWFIDFEFPNKKGKPYKSSGGEMVDSELGKIPKGWIVGEFKDILKEIESGSRPKGGIDSNETEIPSIGAENINGIANHDYSKEKYIRKDFFDKMKQGIVKNNDVLMYKDGAKIGRISFFDYDYPHKKCAINEHVFILRSNEKINQEFLYFWLDRSDMTQSIINLNSNAAQPGINQTQVKTLPIFVPNRDILNQFQLVIKRLFHRIFENAKQNQNLSQIRDSLLPRLMSGKIRVPVEVRA